VPGGKVARVRGVLRTTGRSVEFWNMNLFDRNPGRIIPAVRAWVDRQLQCASRCRFIGEPVWPGRTRAEVIGVIRNEALINVAFAGRPTTTLCPYDAGRLGPSVVEDAARAHPLLLERACHHASPTFADPLDLWRGAEWPLPDPSVAPAALTASRDLTAVRRFAEATLEGLWVSGLRRQDLVLVVDEAATNAVLHGGGAADIRIWREDARVVCEVSDQGRFDQPLVGRQRLGLDWTSGRGVWLMNELCDLVELRPTETGTVARMHVELEAGAAEAPTAIGGSAAMPRAFTESAAA
jgi:anti-sigma regulatory factor (Ser/Thr protein kinase)